MITEQDENQILEDALTFEKKHNKGRWYINPRDSNDFVDYLLDEIDEDLVELLNIYGIRNFKFAMRHCHVNISAKTHIYLDIF